MDDGWIIIEEKLVVLVMFTADLSILNEIGQSEVRNHLEFCSNLNVDFAPK